MAKKAKIKTAPTDESVEEFLNKVEDTKKREDCFKILDFMKEITGDEPVLWRDIIGFGNLELKYASGRVIDYFKIGFTPRKANITIYVMPYLEVFKEIIDRLGNTSMGKGCLYIKKLEDINIDVLKELIKAAVEEIVAHHDFSK